MSSTNTALWDNLGRTDPAHTKAFTRGGGFKGTAIKPMWSYRRMTEEFGPCGLGWGVGEPAFQVVPGPEGEVLVFCTASIWYRQDEAECRVYGVGGDKAVGKNKYGLNSDDEAFKKAFTDAVTNALKLIGVGADVHMGMFDDNKYVNTMRQEFADDTAEKPKRVVGINPKTGMQTAYALKKTAVWENEFQPELLGCETATALTKFALAWSAKAETDKWPAAWRECAKDEINKRREVLINGVHDDDDFPGDRPSGGTNLHMAG